MTTLLNQLPRTSVQLLYIFNFKSLSFTIRIYAVLCPDHFLFCPFAILGQPILGAKE